MSSKYLRIPGITVWMIEMVVLVAGACLFFIAAGIFAFRTNYFAAVLSFVAMFLFAGGARFESSMNNDYYLINGNGVKVIQRGKQIAMLRWEEFTDAAIQRMSHNGNMWFYLVLHARMERGGVCVQDRRISIPLPFSTRKRQRLFDYVRKSKLKIDYAGGEAEEIDARLR